MATAVRPIGFADWIWDGVTIDTHGSTEITANYDVVEHLVNQYGTSPTDVFVTGLKVEITGNLVFSQANMIRAMPFLSNFTTTEFIGAGSTIAGVKGSAKAKSLVIHPQSADTTNDDWRIHKGVMVPNGPLAYAQAADDGRLPVRVFALVDETKTLLEQIFRLGNAA